MLETVRAYAALELTSAGERDDALEGLVGYCHREASLAADGLLGPAQLEWLHRVRDDLESYRTALAWLIERGRGAEAADIAWKLMFFCVIRGTPQKASGGTSGFWSCRPFRHQPSAERSLDRAPCGNAGKRARPSCRDIRSSRAQICGDVEIAAYAELLLGHVEYRRRQRSRRP